MANKQDDILRKRKWLIMVGTLDQGGAEKQLYYIVQSLLQAGHSVDIVTLHQGQYWQGKLEALGITVHHNDAQKPLPRLWKMFGFYRKIKPDAAWCLHFFTTPYMAIPARVRGIRPVGSIRNNGHHELEPIGKKAGWLFYHLVKVLIANSEHGAANMRQIFGTRTPIKVLPNVIDTTQFAYSPRPAGLPLRLVNVSRMVPLKQLDKFLHLVQRTRSQGYAVVATLVGYGPQEEALKQLATELGIADAVTFTGRQTDVRPYLQQAHILVSTSAHEGVSNTMLEAMACGLPVITLHLQGIEHLITHNVNGKICHTEQELEQAILFAINNMDWVQQAGQAARQKIERDHAPEGLAERFLQAAFG